MRGKTKLANANARAIGNAGDTATADTVMGEIVNAGPTPLSPHSPDDLNNGETSEMEYTSSSTPGSQPRDMEHRGLFDDTLLGWSTVSNGGLDDTYGFDERHADDIFGTLQDTASELSRQQQQLSGISQGYSQPPFSHTANALDPAGMEGGYQAPRTTEGQFSLRRSATTTPPQMTATDSERNNQCVIACSQIIFTLEKYQVDKLKVLDLILSIVKGVTKKLESLVNGQLECPNTKCLAMFDIIRYQLVEILEAGCADFLANTSDVLRPLSMELLEPGFHELDFGGFGMGLQDQERFRSQIILEVLRPVIKIMQKVLFISTSAGLDRDNCSQEGQNRLKTLEEKIKKRAGGL
jgi:hypothetical protein